MILPEFIHHQIKRNDWYDTLNSTWPRQFKLYFLQIALIMYNFRSLLWLASQSAKFPSPILYLITILLSFVQSHVPPHLAPLKFSLFTFFLSFCRSFIFFFISIVPSPLITFQYWEYLRHSISFTGLFYVHIFNWECGFDIISSFIFIMMIARNKFETEKTMGKFRHFSHGKSNKVERKKNNSAEEKVDAEDPHIKSCK